MTSIRTVHVGARGRGQWALELMTVDPRFTPVAIVSRDPDAVVDIANRAGIARQAIFTTLAGAASAVDADAAVIATPVDRHGADVRVACTAGLHVLVEKCLSNNWPEAVELVETAEGSRVELIVAQNYRFRPETAALAAALASGRYGRPEIVDLALHKYRPLPRQQDYPCAVFWDQGCHHVDELQAMLGPIAEVDARTFGASWSQYRDDGAISVRARFDSGATWICLLSNLARHHAWRSSIHTERGAFVSDGGPWRWLDAVAPETAAFGWNAEPVELEPPAGSPPTGEHGVLDEFATTVVSGAASVLSGRANLEALRVCEMVERSVRSGRPVSRADVEDSGYL
jgi:predicted dehydrogenase